GRSQTQIRDRQYRARVHRHRRVGRRARSRPHLLHRPRLRIQRLHRPPPSPSRYRMAHDRRKARRPRTATRADTNRKEPPMTDQTPIERAAQAIRDDWQMGRQATELDRRDARTAFESIDTNQLADALHGDQCPEDPDPGDYCTCDGAHYDRLALVVKNWLTGKEEM